MARSALWQLLVTVFWCLLLLVGSDSALSLSSDFNPTQHRIQQHQHQQQLSSKTNRDNEITSRRDALASLSTKTMALVIASSTTMATPKEALAASTDPLLTPDMNGITTVTLDSPENKIGVELYDVPNIGNPPRTYPAVKAVKPDGVASTENVQPGMIILGNFDSSQAVVSRIRNGPYPMVLQFYDLGRVGNNKDNPIPPQQALVEAAEAGRNQQAANSKEPELSNKGDGLKVKTVQKPTGQCDKNTKVRRGDTLEINFEARVASPGGPLYDSSAERGGPVSFVTGAGEVVNGVDIGVYDMCPGEIRTMDIPAALGYGRFGSDIFDIPGDVRLWWKVELLQVTKGKPKVLFKY